MASAVDQRMALESGDRLTRAEFHARYLTRPDIKKAELVEGVVYVASPVLGRHARPHSLVIGWLVFFASRIPGLDVFDNASVILNGENEVQPDAFLLRGQTADEDKRLIERAPDLIVEVAASSASYDLHDKKEVYRRAGVSEYVVWRGLDQRIDWFRLVNGAYIEVQPDADAIIESATFPGLRLNVPAMLAGDMAAVLAAVR